MKIWLLLLGLAFVASAASTDPHKPVRGVFQMCANCQARRWPELRRFIKDAVQGGEYGQQLSLEYARADKPLLVVYGPYDQVVGRFNIADQSQEKLHELVQNFGFNRAPASTSSKVAAGYNAFASDVADPTAGLNNGLGNGLNSAFYNAYGVYNAYSAFGAGAAAAGTDPNGILAAGSYWPGGAVAPSGLAGTGVGAQAGLDYNAAALGGSHLGALNTGNLGAVSPGSAFSTLGAASNAAAAGSWGALGAAAATGTPAGAALPAAGAGAAAGHAAGSSSQGALGAAAPATGAGAAAGGLGGFGALGGGLGAFGAGGGLGSFAGGLGGGLGSAASLLGGGGGGSLLGVAAPAAAEEKPRPYPIGFSGFGRRRRQ